MTEAKSEYADLLEERGFCQDNEPSEVRSAILALPTLPEKPIYSIIGGENNKPLLTFVVDEVGTLWRSQEPVLFPDFENYFDFQIRHCN